MNDFFKIAEDFVKTEIGNDVSILKDSIEDLEDLYCFTYQSKEYLKTNDFSSILVGQGYLYLNKSDKRIFSIGSTYPLESGLKEIREWLYFEKKIRMYYPDYELNIKYDIIVTQINDKEILKKILIRYETSYIIPEVVSNFIYRISKNYNSKILDQRLELLPSTFKGISQSTNFKLITNLIESNCCKFDIVKHINKNYSSYLDATILPEDLKPEW